ncbi:DUF4062 domain-containing protein [Nocardia lasii]|uniref:DUF4062 domain-containing protein n=1 Tax=Nocardia lasii TaxID=1616107 RepID=A0ABW1JX38_9NOCA
MEKRYQVFVSSTYRDLADERAQVIQAILKMDHLPAGMEMFPSADESQWELIEQVIDQSDYYIVVVAGRYGSIIDADGISYTEKEYDYAVQAGIPVLGFVHKDPGSIPARDTDTDATAQALLNKFREKVQSRPVNFFNSPAELGGMVVTSLIQAIKRKPGVGWVRGNLAMTLEQEREMISLREQIAALKEAESKAKNALVEDTSKLAGGDEEVTLWLGVRDARINKEASTRVRTTWDAIYRDISPAMADEETEGKVRTRVASHLVSTATEDDIEKLKSAKNGQPFMYTDDWELVKTQFRALGLIDNGIKKRPVNDTNKYLRLTPQGDRHMTTLIAVPKGEDPNADVGDDDDAEMPSHATSPTDDQTAEPHSTEPQQPEQQ